MIHQRDSKQAFRAGMGALIGFMLGTGLKLISSFVMTYYFLREWLG